MTTQTNRAVKGVSSLLVGIGMGATLIGACAKKTKTQDSPELLKAFEDCKRSNEEKTTRIRALKAELGELKMNGSDGEVVVSFEAKGKNGLTIVGVSGGKGPNARAKTPTGDAKDAELYQAFLKAVNRSRGAIKKCYQRALKDKSLQARTINLSITVNYASSGKVRSASFRPQVSSTFNSCMTGVTKRWTIPAAPSALTFRAPVTLTPQ